MSVTTGEAVSALFVSFLAFSSPLLNGVQRWFSTMGLLIADLAYLQKLWVLLQKEAGRPFIQTDGGSPALGG